MIAVEVREKDDGNVAWVDAQAMHVRQQGRATVEKHAAVEHHGPVVAVEREGRPATEERELYAMVTAGFR